MNNLHEAPLLYVIKQRLQSDSIYTYTGNVLVSLNPYKSIPGLYDNPLRFLDLSPSTRVENGLLVTTKKASPHVFAIANNALRALDEPSMPILSEEAVEVCDWGRVDDQRI